MLRSAADRWLTWLILPASAALVLSAFSLSRHAYTGVGVQGDRVETVLPGSPGDLAGLRPGDQLRPGDPSARVSPLDPDPTRGARPGVPLLLRRLRAGRWSTVWLAPAPLPEAQRRFKAFLFCVACGFLLLGGWVWSERRDRLTRAFLVLCVAFAGMLTPEPQLETPIWQRAYELGYTAAQLLIPIVFAHFFALFPEPEGRTRGRLWVRTGYTLVVITWLAWLALVVLDRFQLAPAAAVQVLEGASLALFAAGLLAGLVLFARSFLRARSADARRRLRVAFYGTLLGAVPFLFVIAWRNLRPGNPLPFDRYVVAFPLAVPASFAWAIAVHRVFDFRIALRAVVVVLLAGLVAGVTFAGGEWLAGAWWPELGEGVSGASLAFLALVAALAGPVRPLLARVGARVVPIAGEVSLGAWAPSPAASRAGDAVVMLRDACGAIVQALRLDGCSAARPEGAGSALLAFAGARLMPGLARSFFEATARTAGPRAVGAMDLAPEDRDTLDLAGVHWVLPVPGTPPPAVLLLGRRLTGPWLDRGEARDLERLADHLAVALENVGLKREVQQRVALDRELEEAHHVQLHRLPRRTPVYPTLDCAAVTLSTESVGGDYYDFVELGPREFTLAVGDAAGHGVPAALVLAGVQSRFRAEARSARHPGEVLEALNRDLVAVAQPEKFVGMVCARVDVTAATVRFANAGLTPLLVRRADGRIEEPGDGGLLLGVREDSHYDMATVELDAGDLALVYTDGLTEAARGVEMFGTEGVRRVLDACAHRRAADIVEELLLAVRRWSDQPLDDLTIVVLRQLTAPGHRARSGQRAIKLEGHPADTNA